MLSDEEKEVVNMIKTGLEVSVEGQIIEQIHISRKEAKALLNLIEKQSKEIEELKEENEKYKNPPFFDEDKYIENDKIKSEIEELKLECENCPYQGELCDELNSNNNCVPGMTILILQSLLEKE